MRATTTRDVEWDEEQQSIALAYDLYEQLICGGCGGYLPDTTAEANDGGYVAELPIRCHQCTAQLVQAEAYGSQTQREALRYPVHLKMRGGPS